MSPPETSARVLAAARPSGEVAALAGGPIEGIRDFFEARAAEVDAGRASVREGIQLLLRHGLADAGLQAATELVATVARSDLASAFSAWAHRMVITYVDAAPTGAPVRELLPGLRSGEILGSTALAAATARQLTGSPIPLTFQREHAGLRLDGRINWASNLIAPFLCVTVAVGAGDPDAGVVLAFRDDVQGLEPAPPPRLLALEGTGSTSLRLDGARIPGGWVISEDVGQFLAGVLPGFLLLQVAFCRGLAARALQEVEAGLNPLTQVMAPDLERLRSRYAEVEERAGLLGQAASHAPASVARRELLELRLAAATLAGEAVRLELAVAGGRGYMASSGTARRLREAAFLPVQAPTEVMLRWTLSRSA
jgi:alkylation response protein AidB-like acyl-CoA dehydrogenase